MFYCQFYFPAPDGKNGNIADAILDLVPGTIFMSSQGEVPSKQSRARNVTSVEYWPLIGQGEMTLELQQTNSQGFFGRNPSSREKGENTEQTNVFGLFFKRLVVDTRYNKVYQVSKFMRL